MAKTCPIPVNFEHSIQNNEAQSRVNKVSKIRNIVVQNLKKAHETSRKFYDLRSRPDHFENGETVWRRNFTKSKAGNYVSARLAPTFLKAQIKRKIGSSSYELFDLHGKSLGIFSVKDLKKDGNSMD